MKKIATFCAGMMLVTMLLPASPARAQTSLWTEADPADIQGQPQFDVLPEQFRTVRLDQADLLARRVVRYAYVYPFVEAGAGVLMIGGFVPFLAAPAAFHDPVSSCRRRRRPASSPMPPPRCTSTSWKP